MLALKTSLPTLMALMALPSYAAAQDLPRMPPAGYYTAVASNPKGTVVNITYGSNYVARVYTPPGYSTSRKYPAMYLMHGLGGSEASWHDNDLYAHIQLDNLLAQGAVDPFIIVFTRNDYANWTGFKDILINELIPYVEGHYSVCANADNRALGGLSMGGMQTINFGFPNADKFHYLMPSSPAPGIQGQSQLFPNGGALAKANLKLIFFSCGSGEVGAYGCNNVDTVSGYAESNGLGSIIKKIIIQGGAHNAATWRPSFWNYAQLAHQAGFTKIAAACSTGSTGGSGGMGGGGAAGGTATGGSAAGGTNGGSAAMGGRAGAATGGSAAGGTNGGSAAMGGRAATGGTNSGTGGSASSSGGTTTQGGAAGMPGTTTSGGANGTGGANNGAGGSTGGAVATTGGTTGMGTTGGATTLGGAPATTGGVPPSTGGSAAGGPPVPPGDDSGCGCSIPGSGSTTAPLSLFAAAAAFLLGRARRRRRD